VNMNEYVADCGAAAETSRVEVVAKAAVEVFAFDATSNEGKRPDLQGK
jgi:hypothetical protein